MNWGMPNTREMSESLQSSSSLMQEMGLTLVTMRVLWPRLQRAIEVFLYAMAFCAVSLGFACLVNTIVYLV